MSQQQPQNPEEGQRASRGGERRGTDRRRLERRAPPPLWRRPWALVSYGVVGALVLVLLWNGVTGDDDAPAAQDEALVEKQPSGATAVAPANPAAAAAGPEDAYGSAGFARLVAEGESAVGKVVRAELYCEEVGNFTVIQGHTAPRSVAALIQEGRVPAARCRWGSPDEPRSELLLLVPPTLAEQFASAPVVTNNFVDRRRVTAELEWVGRGETLALRTAGVFRGLVAGR